MPAKGSPTAENETPEAAAEVDRLVGRLSTVVFLEWLGAGAIVPLFPLYLKEHGASPTLIGLTMSAFFFAGLLANFPAGRLADRIGRRPVLVGGLLLSQLITLYTTPVIYLYMDRLGRWLKGGRGARAPAREQPDLERA